MKERDEKKARAKLLEDCRRPAFARLARYSKPVDDGSGDVVTRASVKFVEAALARWGNVHVHNQLVRDTPEARIVCVIITDQESGVEYSKEVKVEKETIRKTAGAREFIKAEKDTPTGRVFVLEATEDDMASREAVLTSVVIRQLGLRILPADLVEECMQVVAETAPDDSAESGQPDPGAIARRPAPGHSRASELAKSLKDRKGRGRK